MLISDIKPYERNARHNDKAIPKVAESIRKFGLRGSIVLESRDNPVIVCGHTRVAEAQVEQVSAITHANPTSTRACARLVNYARQLAAGRTPLDAIGEAGYETALADEPEGMIRSGGYVLDTLKAAVWCLVTTDDYAGCALKAVNLGADTDTTAAVAGGLAGIVYGIDSIPAEWIAKLRGKDVIDACLFA